MSFLDSIRQFFQGKPTPAPTTRPGRGYRADQSASARPFASPRPPQTNWESPGITLTEEFKSALNLLEHTKQNVFVTGGAGTGKSTLLKLFKERTSKRVAVVAPTGVAALNVGGVTIHSFAQLPPKLINSQVRQQIQPTNNSRKIVRSLDALIIDEVSMVRADILDGLHLFLRRARDSNAPFGGLQLIFVGDLFQLPPVCEEAVTAAFGGNPWKSPFFFSARCLTDQPVKVMPILLNQNQRQADDENFFRLLNSLRHGQVTSEFLAAMTERAKAQWPPSSELTILTPTKQRAEKFNSTELASLQTPEFHFPAKREGTFLNEADSDENLPAPKLLKLRVGARVMFTKNDSERRWVNGSIGRVIHVDEHSIEVERTDCAGKPKYIVQPVAWERIRYRWDDKKKELQSEVVGSYSQFPLMLAWAMTIHKAQGKTLDKVGIDLTTGAFASGQVYVALSRSRTLAGIFLRSSIKPEDILIDDRVVAFNDSLSVAITAPSGAKSL